MAALPAAQLEREEFLTALTETLLTLEPRERRMLTLYYGLSDGQERTMAEVGEQFGISGPRVRQILTKALRKLRHPYRSQHLVEGLEMDL